MKETYTAKESTLKWRRNHKMPDDNNEYYENMDDEEDQTSISDEELNTMGLDVYSGGCKYFLNEPYMTPNNYDIDFNPNNIPSNIQPETAVNLQKRLQKLMPLTKYIHLMLNSEQTSYTNHLNITTKMRINNKEVKFI